MNLDVLAEFSDLIDLRNMEIDEAIRYYLKQFTLPAESQQVDRIMQKFSDKFYRDNKEQIFKSADVAYTLSYLLIMLQTDLHNPQVTEKMKLVDFKKLARGMNDGEDLPAEYMNKL